MAISLVEVSCNLCGGDDAKLICVDSGYNIRRCARCSLIYVTPRPQFQVDEDVNFHDNAEAPGDPTFRTDKERVYEAGLDQLGQLNPGKGRLLDIGCGFGHFLEQARRGGWEPYGIDVSAVSVDYAGRELGLQNVQRRDLFGAEFPSGHFEAATLWNVLEHVPDPNATLSEVRRILRSDGGTVVVRVPNMLVHHLLWLARPLLTPALRAAGKGMQPYLGGISPPQHLYG
ncbi:MAG: class I SAM-dependent methyltransferase, partial [Actinobacteria bacterium]|nr:class I SAM-dependent methyltransferase [Actinomycetota bacterium]